MLKSVAALLLVLLSASSSAASVADSEKSPIDYLPSLAGDYFKFDSKSVGRPYHIFVRLPPGYEDNPSKNYPVIYLLDGDSLFPMLAPTHLFLTYDEQIPEAIIVGIAYGGFGEVNKRGIDFRTFSSEESNEPHGPDKFLSFLKNELLPKVAGQYRTDETKRVLVGQSYGGFFVLWSALQDPDLFWARIASNTSFGDERKRLFSAAANSEGEKGLVAITIGTQDTQLRQDFVKEWSAAWKESESAPWQVKEFIMEGGTHAATIAETYRQTLKWLFQENATK
ncbi:MAG: alpha/beta hydrolase-fold protein [Idiomarina sp.]